MQSILLWLAAILACQATHDTTEAVDKKPEETVEEETVETKDTPISCHIDLN